MVMNSEINWLELYKGCQYLHSVCLAEQQALDETMETYLQSAGPPPARKLLEKVIDLQAQVNEKRAELDRFIATYTTAQGAQDAAMPSPGASLDKG